MKNKKGFTLVELLAVIAILAILVIIALPNVMGMFNNAKKSTFVTEVQNIYKQVATDFVSDSLKSTGALSYCQYDSTVTASFTVSDYPSKQDNGTYKFSDNTTCKPLNLTTTKNYYVDVDSNGSIKKLVVYDGSFYFADSDGVAKVTDITDTTVHKAEEAATINFKSGSTSAPSTQG